MKPNTMYFSPLNNFVSMRQMKKIELNFKKIRGCWGEDCNTEAKATLKTKKKRKGNDPPNNYKQFNEAIDGTEKLKY